MKYFRKFYLVSSTWRCHCNIAEYIDEAWKRGAKIVYVNGWYLDDEELCMVISLALGLSREEVEKEYDSKNCIEVCTSHLSEYLSDQLGHTILVVNVNGEGDFTYNSIFQMFKDWKMRQRLDENFLKLGMVLYVPRSSSVIEFTDGL